MTANPSKPGEREVQHRTLSGLEVKELYTKQDIEGLDYERDLGEPGSYPFTRGPYPNMYRGRLWTRRQIAGFGTAQATNQRYRFLLEPGALIESLYGEPETGVEEAWEAEIKRRVGDLDARSVETVPWSAVRDRLFRGFE